jgi:hypothetical protein
MPKTNNKTCPKEKLLTLIGQQFTYHKQQCEVIELLDDCQLVLQVLQQDTSIQATQYGEGHRAVPVTHVIPVFDSEGALHPDLEVMGIDELLCEQLSNLN